MGYERRAQGRDQGQGKLLFTRASADGPLELEKGVTVQSAPINGHVYQLKTTAAATFLDGQLQLEIPVEAKESGSGYNLAQATTRSCRSQSPALFR